MNRVTVSRRLNGIPVSGRHEPGVAFEARQRARQIACPGLIVASIEYRVARRRFPVHKHGRRPRRVIEPSGTPVEQREIKLQFERLRRFRHGLLEHADGLVHAHVESKPPCLDQSLPGERQRAPAREAERCRDGLPRRRPVRQGLQERQPLIRHRKVRVDGHGALRLLGGRADFPLAGENLGLGVALQRFKVPREAAGRIDNGRRRRRKLRENAGRQPIGHRKHRLRIVAIHGVAVDQLAGRGLLNPQIQPEPVAESQQRSAHEKIRAGTPGHVARISDRDAPSAERRRSGPHALGGQHRQIRGLGQAGRDELRDAAVHPIERGVTRQVLDEDHPDAATAHDR